MPLVIVCGQPCSGKSSAAKWLADSFSEKGQDVSVIDEPSLHLSRNTSYKDPANEKNTRGALKAAVDRRLTQKRIVILDSLNNIKGFRYELWCIARAAGGKFCLVHCNTPAQQAREWNRTRPAEESYSEEIFDDLAGRFEMPDAKNRWDAPLFTVSPSSEEYIQQLEAVTRAILQDPKDIQRPGVAKKLTPTLATTNPPLSATNLLTEIDRATQDVITSVVEAQSALEGTSGAVVVEFGQAINSLQLPRTVLLAELRRHKRAFMKLATQISNLRIQDSEQAKRMFVDYLRDNIT